MEWSDGKNGSWNYEWEWMLQESKEGTEGEEGLKKTKNGRERKNFRKGRTRWTRVNLNSNQTDPLYRPQ